MPGSKYLLAFLLLTGSCLSFGQTQRIDSLKKQLAASIGESRISLLLLLCEESGSMNADSLYAFASEIKNSGKAPGREQQFIADYYITRSLLKWGLLDSAGNTTARFLAVMEENKLDDTRPYRMFLATRGNLLIRKSEYKEAIRQYDALLRNAERNNDIEFQSVALNGIGWAYMEMNRYPDALKWFHSALQNKPLEKNERYTLNVLNNMGAVYNTIGQRDSGIYYIRRSIALAKQYQDLSVLANALNILASIYIDAGQQAQAEVPLNEALEYRKKIGDPFYIVSDISQLASYYATNNRPEKGIELALQGIELARKYKMEAKLRLLYNSLAENYKAAGDMANYSATLEKILALNDSLYNQNPGADLASIHANYELQKKENIIMHQKLDIFRKNVLFYSSLALLLITGLFSFIIFRNYRRKQRQRMELMLVEEKRLLESAIRDAEEKERKRIAADLHDNLGAYAAAIASNIDTAVNRGEGNDIAIKELKTNSQAMVAQLSDTIWVLKKDSLSLTAISDRIKVFLQRLRGSYPAISMEVQENVREDVLLPPSQAYHLFSIVQEGVNNALRHSGGNEVAVHIESNETWKVIISDNGTGMEHRSATTGSNGIHNMRERAAINKWMITWDINHNGGTSLIIKPE